MASVREQALQALFGVLEGIPFRIARRGGELPVSVPDDGLMILRDGDPGEPEITMSPMIYEYRHVAEIEVVLQPQADGSDALDDLLGEIGAALAADRTLGGAVMWVEPQAPVPVEVPVDGGLGIVATIVPVALHYTTTGPLA